MYLENSQAYIQKSTFVNNKAYGKGGALSIEMTYPYPLYTIINESEFINNHAVKEGAAIYWSQYNEIYTSGIHYHENLCGVPREMGKVNRDTFKPEFLVLIAPREKYLNFVVKSRKSKIDKNRDLENHDPRAIRMGWIIPHQIIEGLDLLNDY